MSVQVITNRLLDLITPKDIHEIKLDDYPKTIDEIINSTVLTHDKAKIPLLKELYEDVKSNVNYPTYEKLSDIVKCCAIVETKWYHLLVSIILVLLVAITFFFSLACLGVSFLILREMCLYYLYLFVCLTLILTATILLFNKYMRFLSRKGEIEAKLKEKMMDNMISAFNEDRENRMLLIKSGLSLHERLEKVRIEQWERIKEYERKMNSSEQERIAKLSDVLIELAKIQDKETRKDSNGKEIISEKSILLNFFD